MYVCMYIYIYVYVCVYIYTSLSIYLSLYISLSLYIYIYIYVYMCVSGNPVSGNRCSCRRWQVCAPARSRPLAERKGVPYSAYSVK